MAIASASALKLAGFLMAHALWVISDFGEGDAYVPQVLCEKSGGGRELFVFEAKTQVEAIERGKRFLMEQSAAFESCVFARDGQVRQGDSYVDVLTLDVFESALPSKLTIIQPYEKAGSLKLLGDEVLAGHNRQLSKSEEGDARENFRLGASEHQGAGSIWNVLNSTRSQRPVSFN